MGEGELLYRMARSKRDTPAVDAVRGFVFTSGTRWLEQEGLLDRFRALVSPDLRDPLESMTAAEWIPLERALAVYAVLDALELSMEQKIDLGRFVSAANNGIVISTIARLVGNLGGSPWLALRHADRTWQRSNRGGAIAVYKLTERIARIEFWRVPLARSPFFTTSMRGAIAVGLEAFCDRVVVTEYADQATSDGFALRVHW